MLDIWAWMRDINVHDLVVKLVLGYAKLAKPMAYLAIVVFFVIKIYPHIQDSKKTSSYQVRIRGLLLAEAFLAPRLLVAS